MASVQPVWNTQLGLAKETTWGTGVVATTFYGINKPKFTVKYQDITDLGFRGNASTLQGMYQGTGHTEIDLPDMQFYPDDTGHLLMAMLGVDSISGVGPYTHALTLLNSALPPSYTLTRFSGLAATSERVTGVNFEEVTLKFVNGSGEFTVAAKGRGKIQDTVAKPAASYSAASIFLPWQAAATIAGGGNARLIDMEVSLKRPVEQVPGMNNSQDMTAANIGPLDVTGKMTFAPVDTTEFAYYTANTQPSVSILFTSGTNTLTLQMTKCAFHDVTEVDPNSTYFKVAASFRAVANSTDAGTGNGPIKITLVNGKAVAY